MLTEYMRSRGFCLLLMLTAAAAGAEAATTEAPDTRPRYVGDTCAEGTGVCRNVNHCPSAIETIQRGQHPILCSFNQPNQSTPIVCCPAENKATRMCNKYGEAVYVYQWTWTIPRKQYKKSLCQRAGKPFVSGGQKADPNEFPHMALIGYGDDLKKPQWNCGGTLISKRYVMTAAHCLQNRLGEPQVVRLGELTLSLDQEKNKHVDYKIDSRIAHPNYRNTSHYDDIALLHLEEDVIFTASTRPACLQTIPEIRDKELIATGWGYTDWTIYEISDSLMKVKLPVQEAQHCQEIYKTLYKTEKLSNGIVEESMMCVGHMSSGKDTCPGDSGGPLQLPLNAPYCMYSVVGITSFGKFKCGSAPAVYTRVSHYIPWIESIVWATEE